MPADSLGSDSSRRNWTDVGITAASLDDTSIVKPESNVYLDHRQPWVIIDDSLRKYDQLP